MGAAHDGPDGWRGWLESGVVLARWTPLRRRAKLPDSRHGYSHPAGRAHVSSPTAKTVDVFSDSTTVFDILADNGIALGPLDYTRPAADAAVRPGDNHRGRACHRTY